ncbi:PKD domain-containing protein [Candidatus Albibeggiatoa sp. nov. NOAA]|uniref:PKD domain-containing protein n=1 Tax=Candidatus Albibeggiatoa sp. nov. NOAA TaxID=3162724 RepID=UPI0032FA466F|nr:PKD domain-containing protein [Thiotrichaceae bacterium]
MIKRLWVILAILCWLPIHASAIQLIDGESFVYDIGDNGVLVNGTLNAYQNMYNLRVNSTNYVGQPENLTSQGREVITSLYTEPNTGLEIRRRIYVSNNYNFARYMEIIRNPTANAQTIDIEVYGTLGSGSRTTTAYDQQQFLITDDEAVTGSLGGLPALLHYHSQAGSPITATHTLVGDKLNWTYRNVEIPAQTQVRLIYFVAQTQDVDTAYRFALNFPSNPISLYEGITANQQAELINFFPPATQTPQFTNPVFLNLDEVRSGFNLEASDPLSSQRANIPTDYFGFDLVQDQTIAIRMTASFDTYLYLFDDQGQLLDSNDDAKKQTTHSEIIFTPTQTGRYYVEATAHEQNKNLTYGTYSIELKNKTINRNPLAHAFTIQADSDTIPTTVTLTDFSQDVDGEVVERCWHFDDATPMVCSAESSITHTYEQAGHYSIGLTVKDNAGGLSFHSESLSLQADLNGVIFPVDSSTEGELTIDDGKSQTRINAYSDRYVIKGVSVGQELVVEMQSTQFDSFVYLYDAFGRQLRFDDNSGSGQNAHLRYTPLYPTDLLLEATSFNDNALGQYNLSVNLVSQDTDFYIPIEAATALDNALKTTFVARIPESFQPRFFLWDFGDGTEFVGTDNAVVSHQFERAGNYTVNLEIRNAADQTVTGEREFTISNRVVLPQSNFQVTPLFGEAPLRTFFTNNSSAGLAGDTLSYLWKFGGGQVATGKNPAHTFAREGVYQVILQTYSSLNQQSASYTIPITVIDRDSVNVPVTGVTRQRPQVLMAGFDPILQDVLETEATLFAIVRPGATPIQSVRLLSNDTDFKQAMQHTATYSNGDQRFETILTFPRGIYPVSELGDLFGDDAGQFQIQALDQAGQFHAYPNLEISDSPSLLTTTTSLRIEPTKQVGIRRSHPQVLAAGFDPVLIDINDGELTVKAIVREGLYPIQNVTLQLNGDNFSLPMRWLETLPNGDKLYTSTYTYPQQGLAVSTVSQFFGSQVGQFSILVTDQAQRSHQFPQYKIGNYLPQ